MTESAASGGAAADLGAHRGHVVGAHRDHVVGAPRAFQRQAAAGRASLVRGRRRTQLCWHTQKRWLPRQRLRSGSGSDSGSGCDSAGLLRPILRKPFVVVRRSERDGSVSAPDNSARERLPMQQQITTAAI